MKALRRLLAGAVLVVAGLAVLGLAVPAARPALRAGLARAGLGGAADRWIGTVAPADRPTDHAGTPGEGPGAETPLPPAVTVVRAGTRRFRDRLFVSGTLVAREEAMVGPQIDGLRITELLADDGDHVARGQVLARLDRTQLDALAAESDAALARADAAVAQAQNAIAQYEATNAQAQADYSRATRLETGVISQSALDSRAAAARAGAAQLAGARSALAVAEADRRSQQAQRHELDVRIARTEVRAPVGGIVTRRTARLGALAMSGGDALFRVTQDGAIDLDAEAPEEALTRVRLGMPASVTVSGTPAPVPGTVRLISSEIDRASRLGHVRIALGADAAARIGAFATAVVEVSQREGVSVPATALVGQDGDWSVEVVAEGDRIQRRGVARGLAEGDSVEIREGLKAGETVVARAAAFLRAGDLVRPMAAEAAAAPDQEASR